MGLPDEVKTICKEINKQYGDDTLIFEEQDEKLKSGYIPTGLPNLDFATKPNQGAGGIPLGRFVEMHGPQSSGKTSLCLSIIAEAQKMGLNCAFFDIESSYNPFFARNIIGVDNDELVISRKQEGEKVLDAIEAMIVSGEFGLIVLDSVASLPSVNVLQAGMDQSHVAQEARMWSQALRKLKGKMSKYNTTFLVTNQLREDPGKMFGNPVTTPMGRAIKFYADMRIEIKRREIYRKDSGDTREDIGHQIRYRVIKNKVGDPGGYALADVWYGEGFDKEKALLDAAKSADIITRAGSWYTFSPNVEGVDEIKKQGLDKLVETIKKHEKSNELFDDLHEQIRNSAYEKKEDKNNAEQGDN